MVDVVLLGKREQASNSGYRPRDLTCIYRDSAFYFSFAVFGFDA